MVSKCRNCERRVSAWHYKCRVCDQFVWRLPNILIIIICCLAVFAGLVWLVY
jgi:hypothetical protein